MLDIATLGLEIDARQVQEADRALDDLADSGQRAERSTSGLEATMGKLKRIAGMLASAFAAIKLFDYIQEATMLASRYNELGIVMTRLGRNAGISAGQLATTEEALKKTGISAIQSRDAIAKLISANIDLSKATDLARVAQDAAVIGGMNSSEAFASLIKGIQSAEKETLQTLGLNVNFQQSYEKLAKSIGKKVDALTEEQKTQAAVNAVMEKAPGIAGAYEASLTNGGKALRSMSRYIEDLKVKLGQPFQNPFEGLVFAATDGLKYLSENVDTIRKAIEGVVAAIVPAMKIAAAWFAIFVAAPAIYTAVAGALWTVTSAVLVYAMNVMIGQANTIGLNTALFGTSVSAQLAAGSLTKAALAGNLLFAAFIGWEIGKYLESQFVEVAVAAEVMTGELLKAWEVLKFAFKDAWDAITLTAREGIAFLARAVGGWFELVADGMRLIGKTDAAAGVDKLALSVVAATEVQGTYASRSAEARAEMEKNIKVIDLDTDRRSTALVVQAKLVEGKERETAATAKAAAAAKGMSDEQKKAFEAAVKAAEAFIKSLKEQREELGLNEVQMAALTAARAAALAPTEKLRKAIVAQAAALAAETKALKERTAAEESAMRANDAVRSTQDKIKAVQQEIDLYGLSATAATNAEANKVRAAAGSLAITQQYRDELLSQADALDQLTQKQAALIDKEKTKTKLDETTKAALKMSDDIRTSLTDALMRGFESGKGFAQNLVDTVKNLFSTLVLRPIIQGVMTGGAGVPGALGAAGGLAEGLKSATTAANNIYGMFTGGATISGGLGTGFLGSLAGGLNGAGIGSGLTSSMGLSIGNSIAGVVGPNVASGIASGLSGLAAAAPWVAGALAVYQIGKAAFGRGPKEMTGNSKLTGSIGAGGFAGNLQDEWKKKGGWFTSSKTGYDTRAASPEMTAGLTSAYESLKASSTDFARVLGLNADSIATRTQTVNIALGKDEAANQKAISDFFLGVGDTIARELLPNIAQFSKEGENASTTLQRVATGYKLIDEALAAMSATFGTVGTGSIAARERLIELSGGLEAFATNTAGFQQNFLSQEERNAPVLKRVTEGLAALGLAGVTTRDQFKDAVLGLANSGALATEAGAKQYAALISMQADAAQVFPAVAAAAETANKKRELEIALMRAQGDEVGALQAERAAELAGMAATLRPLQELVWARQDEAAATAARQSLEIELMRASGDTAGALAIERQAKLRELAAIDATLPALQSSVWAREDEKAAIEKANEAREKSVNAAYEVVSASIGREKAARTAAHELEMNEIGARIEASNAAIQRMSTLSSSLKSALDGMVEIGGEAAARADAQQQIKEALRTARTSGAEAVDVDKVTRALSALGQGGGRFASFQDYQRDFLSTAADIAALSGITDSQLTIEERNLSALQDLKATTEVAYKADIAYLDKTLELAQQQRDAMLGNLQAVLDLPAALAALINSGGDRGKVVQAYQESLGRAPDAAGMGYWNDRLAGGISPEAIADSIANSTEAKVRKLYETVLGRTADKAGLEYWLNTGASLEAVEAGLRDSAEGRSKTSGWASSSMTDASAPTSRTQTVDDAAIAAAVAKELSKTIAPALVKITSNTGRSANAAQLQIRKENAPTS